MLSQLSVVERFFLISSLASFSHTPTSLASHSSILLSETSFLLCARVPISIHTLLELPSSSSTSKYDVKSQNSYSLAIMFIIIPPQPSVANPSFFSSFPLYSSYLLTPPHSTSTHTHPLYELHPLLPANPQNQKALQTHHPHQLTNTENHQTNKPTTQKIQ
ncbi:MAG: hypothetical protein JOS17DRAFT_484376 [Linnemannia elongata]|nr:MAG: hypothetical protein JOS17DRAFT_484376 [Linnemannia elongata]